MMLTHAHTVATHTRHAHACASRNTHNACIYAHVEPFCCTKSVVQTHISMHVHTRPCTDTHMHTRLFFQPQQVKKTNKKTQRFQAERLFANCCLFNPAWSARWVGFTAGESLVNHRKLHNVDSISNVCFQEKNCL